MNKNTISKIALFMTGISSRMEENINYFVGININFVSGNKVFPAKISYDSKYIVDYKGLVKEILPNELGDFISVEAQNYDSMEFIYSERGANIIIKANDKDVKMTQSDATSDVSKNITQSHIGGREYVVNPLLAKDLLTEIGILAKNGKIKNDMIRKYNQIDHFVELVKDIIDELGKKEIVVMDCACGKSYLSFVLNFYMRDILKLNCKFICVDYSEQVINASKDIAKKLCYTNMNFVKADLKTFVPNEKVDIVISLHACDTATDMALALGIRSNSRAIICVPCCHKDLLKQYSYAPFEAILKHGILKARLADTLTDGLRALYLESVGYKVTMAEYISPLETPKNIMLRAVYTGKNNEKAKKEYRELKKTLSVQPAIERFI